MLAGRQLLADHLAGLFDVEVAPAEQAVGFAQGPDGVRAEPPAFQSNLIDAADFRWIAIRDHKGRHILDDFSATTHDDVPADAAELVHPAQSTDHGVILHYDVAREGAVI